MKNITDFINTYEQGGIDALLDQTNDLIGDVKPANRQGLPDDVKQTLSAILGELEQEKTCLSQEKNTVVDDIHQSTIRANACVSYINAAKKTGA